MSQRIGPALRALRRREGLTLAELAEQCGLSRTAVSRIERGRCDVSLPSLMRLSAALGVDVAYFASYQNESSQTEHDLLEILLDIGVEPEVVPGFRTLSYEAQAALLDGLRWLTRTRNLRPLRAKELVNQILRHGIGASIPYILSGIAEFGLDIDGFCRAITQMEELPGERLVMSDRLLSVTTPIGGQIDPVDVFRSIFQREPDDPNLVQWWAQSLRSAVRQNVERFESRTIYPLSSIHSYIHSGYWGAGVEVTASLMRQHVSGLIQTLRMHPNMKMGLLNDDVPFNLLVKGEQQAMAYVRREKICSGQGPGIAFRSTRTDVIREFREYFENLWGGIPTERKDSRAVASWLESQLATTTS